MPNDACIELHDCAQRGEVLRISLDSLRNLQFPRCRAGRGWQLCKHCSHALREQGAVEVRKLGATVKRAQLMHEQERVWGLAAFPLRIGSVEQPDIPGVNLSITILQADRTREQLPEGARCVPVVVDVWVLEQLTGLRDILSTGDP